MARLELATLTRTITADALAHPTDLGPMLAKRHSVSRGTMSKQLKRLVDSGWLERTGITRPHFKPGVQREVTNEYAIAGLDEHTPWLRDIHPVLQLSPAVAHATASRVLNFIRTLPDAPIPARCRSRGAHNPWSTTLAPQVAAIVHGTTVLTIGFTLQANGSRRGRLASRKRSARVRRKRPPTSRR